MHAYETIATVENDGQVHLAGVPFAAGTEIEVKINAKRPGEGKVDRAEDETLTDARDRMQQLFAALDKARNTESVGALNRDELYDRNVLR